jgi:succinate dehydrogenase/fumarate reductase flavoprotein subunit
VLRDPQDKPIGPYVTKPDRVYGDMTMEVSSTILEDYFKAGRGPTYMDCRGISSADFDYMMHWLEQEGNGALMKHMAEEGIDPQRHPIEFGTYHIVSEGKISINEKGETSLKGLYAAGDEAMLSIGPASTYGWIAGENAAGYARRTDIPDIGRFQAEIDGKKAMLEQMESRKQGPDWREANIAVQQIMQDYAGVMRSETMLEAGHEYLKNLKLKIAASMVAKNRWELTRCLEVFNLLEIGELVFLAAKERKETRGLHKRYDYPLTDPMLNGRSLLLRLVDGQPVMEWIQTD